MEWAVCHRTDRTRHQATVVYDEAVPSSGTVMGWIIIILFVFNGYNIKAPTHVLVSEYYYFIPKSMQEVALGGILGV